MQDHQKVFLARGGKFGEDEDIAIESGLGFVPKVMM
jgi:hypothetical protein